MFGTTRGDHAPHQHTRGTLHGMVEKDRGHHGGGQLALRHATQGRSDHDRGPGRCDAGRHEHTCSGAYKAITPLTSTIEAHYMAWWRGIVAIMAGGSALPDMRHRADLTMIVGTGGVRTAGMSTHDRDHTRRSHPSLAPSRHTTCHGGEGSWPSWWGAARS